MKDNRAAFLCTACFLYHDPPNCKYDITATCLTCGKPKGARWIGADGGPATNAATCVRCWEAAGGLKTLIPTSNQRPPQ